jgi:hypothetical protein
MHAVHRDVPQQFSIARLSSSIASPRKRPVRSLAACGVQSIWFVA